MREEKAAGDRGESAVPSARNVSGLGSATRRPSSVPLLSSVALTFSLGFRSPPVRTPILFYTLHPRARPDGRPVSVLLSIRLSHLSPWRLTQVSIEIHVHILPPTCDPYLRPPPPCTVIRHLLLCPVSHETK